jgi:hypothetical protein
VHLWHRVWLCICDIGSGCASVQIAASVALLGRCRVAPYNRWREDLAQMLRMRIGAMSRGALLQLVTGMAACRWVLWVCGCWCAAAAAAAAGAVAGVDGVRGGCCVCYQ